MSRFRFRRLEPHKISESVNEMVLSIPPPRSPTGKIHRCCPVPDCVPNLFQLGEAPSGQTIAEVQMKLVRRSPGTPGITCPYCGHDAMDDEFVFRGDIDAAKEYIESAVADDVGDYFENLARDFNRRVGSAGKGLFSISMKVSHPHRSRPFVWREDLLRDLTCDICGRRYGVYALALYCPDCGARNVHVHFQREVDLIRQEIELAKKVEAEGDQELAYRLLGNAHEDVLTVFETYLKTIFRFLVKNRLPEQARMLSAKKMVGNKFQNVERGRELFAKVDLDPYDSLPEADLNFLRLNIEKRHVIGHNLSMADDTYFEAAQSEQPGQTVPLLAEEILRFAEICGMVIVGQEERCTEFLPSSNSNP